MMMAARRRDISDRYSVKELERMPRVVGFGDAKREIVTVFLDQGSAKCVGDGEGRKALEGVAANCHQHRELWFGASEVGHLSVATGLRLGWTAPAVVDGAATHVERVAGKQNHRNPSESTLGVQGVSDGSEASHVEPNLAPNGSLRHRSDVRSAVRVSLECEDRRGLRCVDL